MDGKGAVGFGRDPATDQVQEQYKCIHELIGMSTMSDEALLRQSSLSHSSTGLPELSPGARVAGKTGSSRRPPPKPPPLSAGETDSDSEDYSSETDSDSSSD